MKILMRTNMWPEDAFTACEVMAYDKIGSNIGNMLFAYSVGRWLLGCDDMQIDPIRDSEIGGADRINKNYDMLIFPLPMHFERTLFHLSKSGRN